MNNSNLSAKSGFSSFLLERGDTSTGYSVTNEGSIKLFSTVSSKIYKSILPLPQFFSILIFLDFKNSTNLSLLFKSAFDSSLL